MKIFIDTANVEQIKKANSMGLIDGVTTNPSLVSKENKTMAEVIPEICEIVDGPISAEVMSLKAPEMIEEGIKLAEMHKNIVIKIPMCEEGLKAVKGLSSRGIKTNVTLVFSPVQALLAARAGATYVSPFLGRLDDIGNPGIDVISQIAEMFKLHGITTEIISASVRNPMHVLDAALVGSDIATIPYGVITQMVKHSLTDIGIQKFVDDYEKAFGNK